MNEKYTIIKNDLLEFDELFDVSQINMSYYFKVKEMTHIWQINI